MLSRLLPPRYVSLPLVRCSLTNNLNPELGYGLCRYPPFDYRPADDGWAWDNDGGRCEDFAGQSQPLRKGRLRSIILLQMLTFGGS